MLDKATAEAAAGKAPAPSVTPSPLSGRQPPPAELGQRLRQHRFPLALWVRLQISEAASSKQQKRGARVAFASVDGNFPEGLHAGRLCELSKAFPPGLQGNWAVPVGTELRVGADPTSAACTAGAGGRKTQAREKFCIGRSGALVIPWASPEVDASCQVDWARGRSLTSLVLAFLQGFEQDVRVDEVTDINLEDCDGNVVARAPYTSADVLGSEVSVLASTSADSSEPSRARQLQWVWITSSTSAGAASLATADVATLDAGNCTFHAHATEENGGGGVKPMAKAVGDFLSFGMFCGAAAKTYRYNFRNVLFRSVATTAKNDADVIRACVGSHVIAACDGSCVWDALRGEHKLVTSLIQPQGGSVGYGFVWFEVDSAEAKDDEGGERLSCRPDGGEGAEPARPDDSLRTPGGGDAGRQAGRARSPSPLGWSGHGLAGGFGDSSEAERLAMLELMRSLAKAIRDGSLSALFGRVAARRRLPKITAFTDSAGLIERIADPWVGLQEDDGIRELSEALNFVAGHARVVLQHVKAHCGTALNEMVDDLAKRGASLGSLGPPSSSGRPNAGGRTPLSVLRGGRPKYRKQLVPLSQVMNDEEDAKGAEVMSNVVFHILEALQEIEEHEQGDSEYGRGQGAKGNTEARYFRSSSSAFSVESASSDSHSAAFAQRNVIPKAVSARSGSWDWCDSNSDGPAWLKSWGTPSTKTPGVSSPAPCDTNTATVFSPSGRRQVPRLTWPSRADETSPGPSNDRGTCSTNGETPRVMVSEKAVHEWLRGGGSSVGVSCELASQLIPEARGSQCRDAASEADSSDAALDGCEWTRAPPVHVSQLKGPIASPQDFNGSRGGPGSPGPARNTGLAPYEDPAWLFGEGIS